VPASLRSLAIVSCGLFAAVSAGAQEVPGRSQPEVRLEPAWMEADAASMPAPMSTSVLSRFSFRPSLGVFESGGIVGLAPRLSLSILGGGDGVVDASGMSAGLRLSLLPPDPFGMRAVLAGGYAEDIVTGPGFWGRLAFAEDVGRLRLAASGQVDRSLRMPGLDLTAAAGASVRTVGPVRVGLEYLASTKPNPLLRGRSFLMPTVGAELGPKLSVSGGVPVGVTSRSASPRVSATFLF
jgi:hypothetical protein